MPSGQTLHPPRWDELLIDAHELLPAIGPAVVLAYAALEIRIGAAADSLAGEVGVHQAFWTWIVQKREYRVQPETDEFAKDVFRMLSGKSLSDDPALSDTFVQLRKARNSFAHEGVARDTHGKQIGVERAGQLVAGARAVLNWIDQLLPERYRSPVIAFPAVRVEAVSAAIKV
jgi:hypothetical protein